MIQFNLLPDIKLEFVKARRMKRLMLLVSLIVGGISIAVLLFALFFVHVAQKKSLNDLQADIKTYSEELKSEKDLSRILTVQNQLGALTSLHEQKPATSRLFTYITQVTPDQAILTKLTVDYAKNTMSIGGKAPTLDAVGVYADTLKATGYKIGTDVDEDKGKDADKDKDKDKDAELAPKEDLCPNIKGRQVIVPDGMILDSNGDCTKPPKAFSEVVLSEFGRNDKGATFTITLKYNPDIFDDTKEVQLIVPSGVQTNQTNLFEAGE
ncbi:hypothetical protein CSA80_04330 [Candidatus Saccharibacteria bacterium]|nr:MAG: hypothetical protein CR973_01595 [Candidatus Saccharibacteria bacterium]PID98897.1 MAG: hypothetical protein CSA80_04330 [Candidatus Saccharibacteria bacterium]